MICIELADNVKQEFAVELDNLRGRGGLRVCILENKESNQHEYQT